MNWIPAAGLVLALSVGPALGDAPPEGAAMYETGRIFVLNPADNEVDHGSPLTIDFHWVRGGVPLGACLYIDRPAGSYVLRAMSEVNLSVDLAAGETKYVELEGSRKAMPYGGELDQVSPKLVRKMKDVTACTEANVNAS